MVEACLTLGVTVLLFPVQAGENAHPVLHSLQADLIGIVEACLLVAFASLTCPLHMREIAHPGLHSLQTDLDVMVDACLIETFTEWCFTLVTYWRGCSSGSSQAAD